MLTDHRTFLQLFHFANPFPHYRIFSLVIIVFLVINKTAESTFEYNFLCDDML